MKIKPLLEIIKNYQLGDLRRYEVLEGGIINTSFKIETNKGKFIVQKLSRIFNEKIIEDYLYVQSYLRTNEVFVPILLSSKEGKYYYKNGNEIWRVFEYIPHEKISSITPSMAYSIGETLGRFHEVMKKSDFHPNSNITELHNTKRIIERLYNVFNNKNNLKKSERVKEEYKLINQMIEKHYLPEDLPKTIIHGDPKVDNFLFRDEKVKAVIDLDTLMEASELIDIGDALRSMCKDKDYNFVPESLNAFLRGYLSETEISYPLSFIRDATALITLELAARYLIDYFEESYFKWDMIRYKSAAEHNLQRCRSLLKYYNDLSKKIF